MGEQSLRECKNENCGQKHHHICAINAGQEDQSTLCRRCYKLTLNGPSADEDEDEDQDQDEDGNEAGTELPKQSEWLQNSFVSGTLKVVSGVALTKGKGANHSFACHQDKLK